MNQQDRQIREELLQLLRAGKFAEAVASARAVIDSVLTHPGACLILARAYRKLGTLDEASSLYEAVRTSPVAEDREVSEAHIGLAAIDFYQGRFDSALNHLSESERVYPANVKTNYTNRADCLIAMGKTREAIELLTWVSAKVKKEAEDRWEMRYVGYQALLARAHWKQGDPARGLNIIRSLINKHLADNNPVLLALQLAYEGYLQFLVEEKYGVSVNSSRMEAAVSSLKAAIEKLEGVGFRAAGGEPYRWLAEVYLAVGDHQAAVVHARKAYRAAFMIGERIEIAHAERVLGVIAFRESDVDQAVSRFARAEKIFADLGVPQEMKPLQLVDPSSVRAS